MFHQLSGVQRAEASVRAELLNNVVVFGGSAEHPGLRLRLTHELRRLAGGLPVRVSVEPEPCTAVWRGGASLARRREGGHWLTREAYQQSRAAEGP